MAVSRRGHTREVRSKTMGLRKRTMTRLMMIGLRKRALVACSESMMMGLRKRTAVA
jgi:hypothetical protein